MRKTTIWGHDQVLHKSVRTITSMLEALNFGHAYLTMEKIALAKAVKCEADLRLCFRLKVQNFGYACWELE